MSVLTRTPQNTNTLQPTKYLLTFDRISTTQYFCQSVNIPGLSIPSIIVDSPLYDYPVTGKKISFHNFDIKFLLDEPALSWQNLYNWFLAIASPVSLQQRSDLSARQNAYKSQGNLLDYSDSTLTILSALNNPVIRIQFHNMFPVSLGDISFDTTQSADDIMTCDASFAYEYFEFIPV